MPFHSLNDIDWRKATIVIGGIILLWGGLGTVVPDPYYGKVATILGALSAMIAYFANAAKKNGNGKGSGQ
jgi:hypothetical protein